MAPRIARRRWTVALVFAAIVTLVGACSGDRKLTVTLPDMGAAESLILGVEQEGEVRHVSAHARGPGAEAVHVEIEADNEVEAIIQALTYGRSLSELGFEAGALRVRPEGEAATTALPPADLGVLVSSVDSGEWTGWQSAEALSTAMRELRVERATPCVDFEEVDIEVPSPTPLRVPFVVALDEQTVLFANDKGRVFEYSPAGLVEHTELSTTTHYRTAFMQDDGTLWLVRLGGDLFRGRLGGTFEAVPPRLPGQLSDWYWIAGSKGTAPLEVFVLDSWGELQRFDGDRWTAIDDPLRSATAPHGISGLVWTGPGRVAFVTPIDNIDLFELLALERRWSAILRLADGQISEDQFPMEPSESPSVLTSIDGFGLVAGTLTGGLYRNEGARWEPLNGSPLSLSVRSIIPLDQGVLFGGSDGVAQFHPGFGFCGHRMFDHGPVALLSPLDGGALLVLSPQLQSGGQKVVYLRRRP